MEIQKTQRSPSGAFDELEKMVHAKDKENRWPSDEEKEDHAGAGFGKED